MNEKDLIWEAYTFANLLYHNTDLRALDSILKFQMLGAPSKWNGGNNFSYVKDPVYGKYTGEMPFPGPVYFTRSKQYLLAPGAGKTTVRLVFDRNKLSQRHKITPRADLNVATGANTDETLTGSKSRFEAEEVVNGPIPLKDGLVKIEVLKNDFEQFRSEYLNNIENDKTRLADLNYQKSQLTKGLIYHYKKGYLPKSAFPERITNNIEDKINSAIKATEQRLKTEKPYILQYPNLVFVDKF